LTGGRSIAILAGVGGRAWLVGLVAVVAVLVYGAGTAHAAFVCQNRAFTFSSLANGRAVSAELQYPGANNGLLRARAVARDIWEIYRMVCLDGGRFAIQAHNGRYVTAELGRSGDDNALLRARATVIAEWERFTFEQTAQTGDFVRGAIKSAANGRFVTAELGYPEDNLRWGMLRARATVKDRWEQFELQWLPLPPQPSPVDADRDGFFAGQDCNDADPAIRPGAAEVRGNGVDENCDGRDADLLAITSDVSSGWKVVGARFTIRKLRVRGLPAGARVEFRCRGKRCPVRRVRAGRARGGRANVLERLRRARHRFRAGQTLEVRITAPNRIGKVVRYKLRRATVPDGRLFCLQPGRTKPTRCT
jgi:putative metal-binding protein